MTRNKCYAPADSMDDVSIADDASLPSKASGSYWESRRVFPVTSETRKGALDTLTNILQPGRILSLEIGEGEGSLSVCVPERILSGISPCFARIIETRLAINDAGQSVLSLPNDNTEAWRILLYTRFARSLPQLHCIAGYFTAEHHAHIVLLTQCWLLGDKYGAAQFQDLIMAEIVMSTARRVMCPKAIAIAALHARPGSPLWVFMVEGEARWHGTIRSPDEIDAATTARNLGWDDIPQAFVDAVGRVDVEDTICAWERLGSPETCMRFMLDGGPDERWLNVPVPFGPGCHAEPQEDEESDEDGSVGAFSNVSDETDIKVKESGDDA